ncbi:hypothetical protein [Streptosporangium sp. NPDC000396]
MARLMGTRRMESPSVTLKEMCELLVTTDLLDGRTSYGNGVLSVRS